VIAPQDAVIKAFRPAGTALPDAGLANSGAQQQNGAAAHAPPPLALPDQALPVQALPDARSAPEEGHCASVQALALAARLLCSAGGDATIRVWDPASLRLQRCMPCPCALFLFYHVKGLVEKGLACLSTFQEHGVMFNAT
jgi:hypothetical protein